MKYFLDTEFIEIPNTIELISIGIKCEDGRTFYAISKEFNLKKAWRDDWIRENVLRSIFNELKEIENSRRKHIMLGIDFISKFDYKNIKYLIKIYGESIKDIGIKIKRFVYEPALEYDDGMHYIDVIIDTYFKENSIDFYGYYADYDWVVFCWIFGRMIDLPEHFPMYCIDLKQILDEFFMHQKNKCQGTSRLGSWLKNCKSLPDYPKQENEHNALADAIWNEKLYKFLSNLKIGNDKGVRSYSGNDYSETNAKENK